MANSGGLASILSDLTKKKGPKKSRKQAKDKAVQHLQLGLGPSTPLEAAETSDQRFLPSHLGSAAAESR